MSINVTHELMWNWNVVLSDYYKYPNYSTRLTWHVFLTFKDRLGDLSYCCNFRPNVGHVKV